MIVKCHQFLQGHSAKTGYEKDLLKSKTEDKVNAPFSYPYRFGDSHREISDDKSTYVLEIEPTDDTFQRTVAICSQWKTTGTPSKYTHWLIPDSSDASITMRLLNRSFFMTGDEMSEFYDTSKVLTTKNVTLSDESLHPEWLMSDQQAKILGQFLALYWMSLAQNQPSKGITGNRLPLVLHDPNSNELLKNEQAADFFAKEIVSRLPQEAQGMISAVFGVKWSEATTSFKKAVCVILSTETGVPTEKKIDLQKGTHDILSKYNHNDREAMNAIGQCIMMGEDKYPEWYLTLRKLKNGIPKSTAPYIMYFSYFIQEILNSDSVQASQNNLLENCFVGLCSKSIEGGADANELMEILLPLAKLIAERWCMQKHPSIDFYISKRKWAINSARIPEKLVCDLLEPLAELILNETENSNKNSEREKIEIILQVLDTQKVNVTSAIVERTVSILAKHFEEIITIIHEEQTQIDSHPITQTISVENFEKMLQQWDINKIKRSPADVLSMLQNTFTKYPGVSNEIKENTILSLNRHWIVNRTHELEDNVEHGESPTTPELKELSEKVHQIGSSDQTRTIADKALSFVKRHYFIWIMDEPAIIHDDDRFLDVAKQWTEDRLIHESEGLSANEMETLEANLIKVFDAYKVPKNEKNRYLSVFRRIKGEKELTDIIDNCIDDRTVQTYRILDLHVNLREDDITFDDDENLNIKFTDAIRPYFLEWSHCNPPFTSGSNGKYTDKWFVTVASEWITHDLQQQELNSNDLKQLESKILNVLKIYRVSDERQKAILSNLRHVWADRKLLEVIECENIDSIDKAIEVASIHDYLHSINLNISDELEHNLREALIDEFLSWQHAAKPFASNSNLRYTDEWFVAIAKDWLQNNLEEAHLDSSQIQALEKDLISVLSTYKIGYEEQNKLLLKLRVIWGEQKMQETLDDTNMSDTSRAICLAGIHSNLKKIPGAFSENEFLEQDLLRSLSEYYLDWSKADKPFASGENLRYEDDWFTVVTEDWLNVNNDIRDMSSEEIDTLRKNISTVYTYYHLRERLSSVMLPLWVQWGDAKLQELLQQQQSSVVAINIANIHNQLRQVPDALSEENEHALSSAMLDCFVAWGKAEKPFASGENLRYEDPWFEVIATQWVDSWMEREGLSSQELSSLVKQIEQACRAYRIKDSDSILKKAKRLFADTYVHENTGTETGSEAISKIAELLFKDQAVSEDEMLCNTLAEYLAESFEQWAQTNPPFAIGLSGTVRNIYGQEEVFTKILQMWQEQYLIDENNPEELAKLKALIKSGFDVFRIPQRDIDKYTPKLDYLIKRGTFEQLRNQLVSPDNLAKIAGIRMWVDFNKANFEEADRLCSEIDSYLVENVDIWLDDKQPMYVETYAYKTPFVVNVLEQWIDDGLERKERNYAQLQKMHQALDQARKELRVATGIDISQSSQSKYFLVECKAYINELNDTTIDATQLAEMSERLINIKDQNEDLENIYVQKLVDNVIPWLHGELPFACGSVGIKARDLLIVSVLNEWCNLGLPGNDITMSDIESILQILKPMPTLQGNIDVDQIREKLNSLYQNMQLHDIEKKHLTDLTREDCQQLADIYVKSKDNSSRKQIFIYAQELLISSFQIWANKADCTLPRGSEKYYQSIELFALEKAWIEQVPADYHEIPMLREVEKHLESSAVTLYRMNTPDINCVTNLIEERITETIIVQLNSTMTPSESLLKEALDSYCIIGKQKQTSLTESLRDELVQCFDKLITIIPSEMDASLVLDFAERWEANILPTMTFDSLDSFVILKNGISKFFSDKPVDLSKKNNVLASLEVRWLNEVIRRYDYEQESISNIAAIESRIRKFDCSLSNNDKYNLDRFLTEHFTTWSKENFKSEVDDETYTYHDFEKLVDDWMKSSHLLGMSLEAMDRLEEHLTIALKEGYGFSEDNCKKILSPIEQQKKEFIIAQARNNVSEDTLLQIFTMYQDDPIVFYSQVFEIVNNLACQGDLLDQVIKFVRIQSDVWQQYENTDLHKGIITFLDKIYNVFESDDRRTEVAEIIQEILKLINYDLSNYHCVANNWHMIKGQMIDRRIKRFLRNAKNLDELSQIWDSEYSHEYCISWNEIVQRPSFNKELRDRLDTEWSECTQNSEKISFISSMLEFASQTEISQYRELLINISYGYLQQDFEQLFADDQIRNKINDLLCYLQKNGVNIISIQQTDTYSMYSFRDCYQALLTEWNETTAINMLKQKPKTLASELPLPVSFASGIQSEKDFILSMIHETTKNNEPRYWIPILEQVNINLSQLNKMDLKEVSNTKYIDNLLHCYTILEKNRIQWAIDDLRVCIKQEAPEFWKALHPSFSFFGSISSTWKKIGGEKYNNCANSNSFRDWLLREK